MYSSQRSSGLRTHAMRPGRVTPVPGRFWKPQTMTSPPARPSTTVLPAFAGQRHMPTPGGVMPLLSSRPHVQSISALNHVLALFCSSLWPGFARQCPFVFLPEFDLPASAESPQTSAYRFRLGACMCSVSQQACPSAARHGWLGNGMLCPIKGTYCQGYGRANPYLTVYTASRRAGSSMTCMQTPQVKK